MQRSLKLGALLALGLATVFGNQANSEAGTPHLRSEVFLSTPHHTFEIKGSALLLQPTGSNLHYAAEALPFPVPSPNWKIHEIDTDYHFGFDVGLKGIFHSLNTNLALNWEHFHSSDSASKTVSLSNMLGPFFEIGPDGVPYKKAKGRVIFHFDEVDLDYGISINFGDRLQSNLFSGIGFARIEQTLSSNFSSLDKTVVRSIKVPSTFMGAGPQLGLDFSYRIVKDFRFTGLAAAALLIGTQKNHTTYDSLSPALAGLGISPPNRQTTNVRKKTQVVPGFEGKLGLSYVFTFGKNTMINLEAGYQAQIYINAIQSIDMGNEVTTPPVDIAVGVYARTFQQTLSNFALAGPYLTLVIGF